MAGRGGEGSVREVRDERRFPVAAAFGIPSERRRGEVVRRVFTKAGLPAIINYDLAWAFASILSVWGYMAFSTGSVFIGRWACSRF